MKISSTVKKFITSSESSLNGVSKPTLSENSSTLVGYEIHNNDSEILRVDELILLEKQSTVTWHRKRKQSLINTTSTIPNFENERRQEKIIFWNKLNNCIQPIEDESNPDITVSPAYSDDTEPWDVSKKVISSPSFNVGTVNVKAEEIGLVFVILLLWAGAITLFINRWGKLRMLEPYQPQYTAPVASPPPRQQMANPPFININIQSTSSLSLNDNYRLSSPLGAMGGFAEWGVTPHEASGYLSPRRSIGGTQSMNLRRDQSPSSLNLYTLNPQRRVRSAVDLVSLVMQEKLNNRQHQHPIPPFAATKV